MALTRRERRKEREKLKKERARRMKDDGVPAVGGDVVPRPETADASAAGAMVDDAEADEVDEATIMAALGFGGFATTKVRASTVCMRGLVHG